MTQADINNFKDSSKNDVLNDILPHLKSIYVEIISEPLDKEQIRHDIHEILNHMGLEDFPEVGDEIGKTRRFINRQK